MTGNREFDESHQLIVRPSHLHWFQTRVNRLFFADQTFMVASDLFVRLFVRSLFD